MSQVNRIPRIEQLSLDACLAMAHKKNPKEHDLDELIASFVRFGFKAFPSIDEKTKVMVAGHGRCLALKKMRDDGYPAPDGIEVDGADWRVPIIRGLEFPSDKERDAFVLADNQHTIRGGWNLDKLTEFLGDVQDSENRFEGLGFDASELSAFGYSYEAPSGSILGGDGQERFDGADMPEPRDEQKTSTMVREVDAPPLPTPKETVSKLGDVWKLGRHVLVVGDSASTGATEDGVARAVATADAKVALVWTDPPWNVAYNENPASKREGAKTIMNDDLGEGFRDFCSRFVSRINDVTEAGVPIYLAMSAQEFSMVDLLLRSMTWHWSSTIIWGKDALVLGRKDYHSQYEPIWYGWREGAARKAPLRDRGQSDLWLIDRPRRSDDHPTMKPIRLVARAIENSSVPNDLVLDPFGGSGTTLLAAEQTGRRAALVELDPRYADVIINRFEQLVGGKAQRIASA